MELTEELKSKLESLPSDKVAQYICLYKNGKTKINGSSACHTNLLNGAFGKGVVAVINKRLNSGLDSSAQSKQAERLYDYLLNRSVWADAFITKDAVVANESHQIIDGNAPHNQFGGACIASRIPWERRQRLHIFTDLVGLGVSEHMALVLMFTYEIYEGTLRYNPLSSHCPLLPNSPSNVYYALRPNEVGEKLAEESYSERTTYCGVQNMCHNPEALFTHTPLGAIVSKAEVLHKEAKDAENGATSKLNLNIFAKAEKPKSTIPVGFYMKALAHYYGGVK